MQTFLPFPDFCHSASVLDWRRLGKQRVECWQILNSLVSKRGLWIDNHPTTLMWKGHTGALIDYGIEITKEWRRRGYNDNMLVRFESELINHKDHTKPVWLGHPKFHAAHRSNLLRKDFKHYSRFGWEEPLDLPYVWPTKEILS